MKLSLVSCLLVLACAQRHSTAGVAAPPERPNLLVIQTDEHNFRTLGCYRALLPEAQAKMWGEEVVRTPNIDRLAARGAICTRFYATTPVCSPSRASFVSGRYPQATAVVKNDVPLDGEIVTFAELLRRAGYATGFAGKWHLDGKAKPGWAPRRKFGFEDNRYMFNRGHWKQLEDTDDGPRIKARDERGGPSYSVEGADEESFTTDFLTDRAIDFVREHKDEPFCFYLSLPDPHGPDTVRAPYDEMYEGLDYERPLTHGKERTGLPSWGVPKKAGGVSQAGYWGMVRCIDDNVGKLVAALREERLLARTIIVFTSDHGDLRGEHGRQNKSAPYEASARVPFLISWPRKIPKGLVVEEALATVDFLPTILGLMDVPTAGREHGRDASPLLLGDDRPKGWRDLVILRSAGIAETGWVAAVTGRWKLVYSANDRPWLFDLRDDPDELTNYFAHPERRRTVRALSRELIAYGLEYDDSRLRVPRIQIDLEHATGNH